jgi:hypothetical protein
LCSFSEPRAHHPTEALPQECAGGAVLGTRARRPCFWSIGKEARPEVVTGSEENTPRARDVARELCHCLSVAAHVALALLRPGREPRTYIDKVLLPVEPFADGPRWLALIRIFRRVMGRHQRAQRPVPVLPAGRRVATGEPDRPQKHQRPRGGWRRWHRSVHRSSRCRLGASDVIGSHSRGC